MAIAILQGMQHKAMANRHECNECVIMKMPHKGCIQHSRVWRHCSIYFAFTKVYICAKVAYYISPRCVHCIKVHKKQQTITSFSQKLHKSSDTKKRRRPTHKQGVRLDTRTIVTKVPRAVYKDKQDALNKLYFVRNASSIGPIGVQCSFPLWAPG